jgi:hypothetical protein
MVLANPNYVAARKGMEAVLIVNKQTASQQQCHKHKRGRECRQSMVVLFTGRRAEPGVHTHMHARTHIHAQRAGTVGESAWRARAHTHTHKHTHT